MSDFKITGTPGEPVHLDTLKVWDWFTSVNVNLPKMVIGGDKTEYKTLRYDWETGVYTTSFLVHPLTRHELADGTVEFRHVGEAEPCGDCKGTKRDNVPYGDPCEACNGTGVKPEPTYLERLPDALRQLILFQNWGLLDDEKDDEHEYIARVICEHMTPKGGEA